jgi:hypothetical protein
MHDEVAIRDGVGGLDSTLDLVHGGDAAAFLRMQQVH